MAKFTAQNQYEKEYFSVFESLCYTRDSWRVWSDFILASAITLSNTFEPFPERKAEREKEYKDCIERLGGVEKPAKLIKIVVMALEEKPEQDFLGELFIKLRLNDHWRGQFFTLYHICEFMAQITLSDSEREIKDIQQGGQYMNYELTRHCSFEEDINVARVVEGFEACNGYTTCMWHNLLTCKIVCDKHGRLQKAKERFSVPYPEELRKTSSKETHRFYTALCLHTPCK